MRYLILVLTLLVGEVSAEEIIWSNPTLYCDGTSINMNTWYLTQIVYDTKTMPMPSDNVGSCEVPSAPAPEDATLITLETPVTQYNLITTEPTYVRVRSCYCRDFEENYNCIYDVDDNGDWIFLDLADHDLYNINDILNCSNWRAEQLINGEFTQPNPPTQLETIMN